MRIPDPCSSSCLSQFLRPFTTESWSSQACQVLERALKRSRWRAVIALEHLSCILLLLTESDLTESVNGWPLINLFRVARMDLLGEDGPTSPQALLAPQHYLWRGGAKAPQSKVSWPSRVRKA